MNTGLRGREKWRADFVSWCRLAAAAIARNYGATVVSTTRRADREALLKAHGATHVLVDDGKIAEKLRRIYPGGVNKVLELMYAVPYSSLFPCPPHPANLSLPLSPAAQQPSSTPSPASPRRASSV